jgi:hypothetical protein
VATGTSSNPDPGSVTTTLDNNLFIATSFTSSSSVNGYPANYVDGQVRTDGTGARPTATAVRNLTTATEDPGTFSLFSSDSWQAYTIAVRPRDIGFNKSVTRTLSGVLPFTGAAVKRLARILAATLSFAPKVLSVTSTNFGSATTSHLVNMPAGVRSGDLLIAMFANSATASVTTPTGWTLLDSVAQAGVRPSLYVRWADGTEAGTQVDFVTSVAKQATAQVYAVSNVSGYNWSGFATGAGTAPDAGNLLTGWVTGRNLYLTFMAENDDNVPSGTPANYGSTTTSVSAAGAANTVVGLASAYRLSDVDSEDSGAWTVASVNWAATTIGLRPYAAGYRDAVRADSPSVYWRMDDRGSLVTMVAEVGANGIYGASPTGAQETAIADGNKAVLFNGTTQYASSNTTLDLSGTDKVTVEFLLNWASPYANNDDLAFEHSATSGSNIGFYANPNQSDGSFGVSMSDGVGGFNSIDFARPSAGVWHHYVFEFDRSAPLRDQVRAWVDGAPVTITSRPSTTLMAGNFGNFVLYLMSRAGTTLFGNGTLDEFAVYPTLLSQARIAEHYNNISPLFLHKQTGKALAGILSFVGSIATQLFSSATFSRTFTATLSFAGAVTNRTAKALPATLSFSGATTKKTTRALFGTLSFVGALTKQTARALTGTLSFSGAVTLLRNKLLTATLSFSGAMTKRTTRPLSATLSFAGTTVKTTLRTLTGILQFLRITPGAYANYRALVLAASPRSYWKFDEANKANGQTAADEIAALTLTYGNSNSVATGVDSLALTRNASNGSTSLYDFGGVASNSIEVWICRTSAVGSPKIFDPRFGSGGKWEINLFSNGDINYLRAGSTILTAVGVAPLGQWIHCVLTYDGTTAKLYVNGVLVASNGSAHSLTTQTGNFFIDGGGTASLDEIAIYDYPLTQSVIADHYGSGVTMRTFRALTGTLSFSGLVTLSKTFVRTLTGALSFSGAMTKQTGKSLAGTLSFIGTLTNRTSRALAATLSFVGSTTKRTSRALTGTLSFSGLLNISKTFVRTLTGTLSFNGAMTKQTNRTLTGALSFVGAMTKRTSRALSGALSFAGTTFKQTARTLTGTLSFSGLLNISKTFVRTLTATLSFNGAMTKQTSRALAGTLSFVGALTKRTSRALTGTLSFVGVLTKQTSRALTATLSFSGLLTISKTFVRTLTATLSFNGAMTKQTGKSLTGALSFIGTVTRRTSRTLTGVLSFAGATLKQTRRALTGTLSFSGAVAAGARYARSLVATLSFSGALTTNRLYIRVLTATLSFSGAVTKRTRKTLVATVSFGGAVSKRTARSIAGVLSFTGALGRRIPVRLSGVLSFSGSVKKQSRLALTATLSFAGNVTTVLVQHTMVLAFGLRTYFSRFAAVRQYIPRVGHVPAVVPVRLAMVRQYTSRLSARMLYQRVGGGPVLVNSENVLQTTITDNLSGQPVLGATGTVTLTDPTNSVVLNAVPIVEVGGGVYRYEAAASAFKYAGTYVAKWNATSLAGSPIEITDLVRVTVS